MAVVELSKQQRSSLESVIRQGEYDRSVAARAQIVLWRAEGRSVAEIARMSGATRPTVYKWLDRYESSGLDGLIDQDRPGRPRGIPESVRSRVVALTRRTPPASTGLSHWSSREMSAYLKRAEGVSVSHSVIARIWKEHDLQPFRQGTFKLSRDPEFAEKVIDIVGLYLDPPEGAVVLSVDEKTQVQALERTQPLLPISFAKSEKRTHDYVRHGTTNLFAALEVATGQVMGKCSSRRRTADFIAFMDQVAERRADQELHVILDNLSTHSGAEVDAWLAAHPNVSFHFTPIGGSWLNQIEIWFGIITRQAIRRGSFGSLRILIDTINAYITDWNQDAKPFTWTAKPKEIIAKVRVLQRDYKKLLANNSK
ncbi:IS630 family transposase [Actinomadura sp. SCN-SB]|uniref:IS630 family transposase n=1 Tax=Actinomadura sp. SCN-SB TaxID=3373092 RepID=UPI0037523F0D